MLNSDNARPNRFDSFRDIGRNEGLRPALMEHQEASLDAAAVAQGELTDPVNAN